MEIPNAEDSWAKVELFRWQYGVLPKSDDFRPLDISLGLQGMADGIDKYCSTGDSSTLPSPMNVASVLRYCARHFKKG